MGILCNYLVYSSPQVTWLWVCIQDRNIVLLREIEEDDCAHINTCPNSEGQIYCLGLTRVAQGSKAWSTCFGFTA